MFDELTLALMPYLEGGLLRHPLVYMSVGDRCDALKANERYAAKRRQASQALRRGDWDKYIALHVKPYRVEALLRCARRGMSGAEYWRCVREVWIGTENWHQKKRQWRQVWSAPQPDRHSTMSHREQRIFESLPTEVTVWRGTAYPRLKNPLAWTLSERVARRFAERDTHNRFILRGISKREDVLAFFLGRWEREVVCRRVRIEDRQSLDT